MSMAEKAEGGKKRDYVINNQNDERTSVFYLHILCRIVLVNVAAELNRGYRIQMLVEKRYLLYFNIGLWSLDDGWQCTV